MGGMGSGGLELDIVSREYSCLPTIDTLTPAIIKLGRGRRRGEGKGRMEREGGKR